MVINGYTCVYDDFVIKMTLFFLSFLFTLYKLLLGLLML